MINHILNVFRRFLKKNNFVISIREELEFKTFDKKSLINNLNHKMLFFLFVIFIDEFELYKNVNHLMNDIYAISIILCELKKQKSKNAFILILSSHETKLKNVFDYFQIDLKNINRDCFLIINEKQTFV